VTTSCTEPAYCAEDKRATPESGPREPFEKPRFFAFSYATQPGQLEPVPAE